MRFYGAEGMTLVPGEQVVAVDDAGAEGLGSVVIAPEQLLDSEATPHACGSVRPASAADVERLGPREETAGGRLLRRLEP